MPLFPILFMDNVIPPVLHILLIIALIFFNLLESQVKELNDASGKGGKGGKDTKNKRDELQKRTTILSFFETKIKSEAMQFVDFFNVLERLKAKLSGNEEDIDSIASSSDKTRPAKAENNEKLDSVLCLISKYDANIAWLLCTTCGK